MTRRTGWVSVPTDLLISSRSVSRFSLRSVFHLSHGDFAHGEPSVAIIHGDVACEALGSGSRPNAGPCDRIMSLTGVTLPVLVLGASLLGALSTRAESVASRAQDKSATNHDPDEVMRETRDDLTELFENFDWDEESVHVKRSVENLWQYNNWSNEADLFARDVALGVSDIPPWEPVKRLVLVVDRFAQRYDASVALRTRVYLALMREASGLIVRHGRTVGASTKEYLDLRAAGKAFTSKDVARWARAGDPVLRDMHQAIDRLVTEVRPHLSPEQRAILERDLAGFQRRRVVVEQDMKRWAKGQWSAKEWGMQDDPIQSGATQPSDVDTPPTNGTDDVMRTDGASRPGRVVVMVPIRCDEFAPETWGVCAGEVAERYAFDVGQRTTADSIVAELAARALDSRTANYARNETTGPVDRARDARFEPIRRAFAELRARLDLIPTTAQRDRADEVQPASAGRPPVGPDGKTDVPARPR